MKKLFLALCLWFAPLLIAQAPLPYSYGAYNPNQGLAPVLLHLGSCQAVHYHFVNTNTVGAWVQLFAASAASAVTVGTTPPLFEMYIPPGASSTSGGVLDGPIETPIFFGQGIVVAVTSTASGSTGVASNVYVGLLLR